MLAIGKQVCYTIVVIKNASVFLPFWQDWRFGFAFLRKRGRVRRFPRPSTGRFGKIKEEKRGSILPAENRRR